MKFIYLLFTIAISVFISLALSEGFLRVKNYDMKNYDIEMWKYAKKLKRPSPNPMLGHEHINNSSAVLQSVEISINNFGMRGKEILNKNERNRILFLGSSGSIRILNSVPYRLLLSEYSCFFL